VLIARQQHCLYAAKDLACMNLLVTQVPAVNKGLSLCKKLQAVRYREFCNLFTPKRVVNSGEI
jgi:hypothetical protein